MPFAKRSAALIKYSTLLYSTLLYSTLRCYDNIHIYIYIAY